jgi:hypothetical protein
MVLFQTSFNCINYGIQSALGGGFAGFVTKLLLDHTDKLCFIHFGGGWMGGWMKRWLLSRSMKNLNQSEIDHPAWLLRPIQRACLHQRRHFAFARCVEIAKRHRAATHPMDRQTKFV